MVMGLTKAKITGRRDIHVPVPMEVGIRGSSNRALRKRHVYHGVRGQGHQGKRDSGWPRPDRVYAV